MGANKNKALLIMAEECTTERTTNMKEQLEALRYDVTIYSTSDGVRGLDFDTIIFDEAIEDTTAVIINNTLENKSPKKDEEPFWVTKNKSLNRGRNR